MRDLEKATFWLRKAAEQGDAKARRRLRDLAARRSSGTHTRSEAYASATAITHFVAELASRSTQCMKAFPKAEVDRDVGNKYKMNLEEPMKLVRDFLEARIVLSIRRGGFNIGGRGVIDPEIGGASAWARAYETRLKDIEQSILHEREKEPGVFKAKCTKLMKDLADGSLDIERRMPDHLGVLRGAEKQFRERLEIEDRRLKREREKWKRELEMRNPDLFPPRR